MWISIVNVISTILLGLAAIVAIVEVAVIRSLGKSQQHNLFPVLRLRIDARNGLNGVVFIRAQIENASKFVLFLPDKVRDMAHRPRVVIREEDLSKLRAGENYSDFLAFTERKYEELLADGFSLAPSIHFHSSEGILTTTETVEPGEVISVEFSYRPKNEGAAIHCGLQVHGELRGFSRWLYSRKRERPGRFTTVAYAPWSDRE